MPYTGNPASGPDATAAQRRDAVRLRAGDTGTTTALELRSDTEYNFWLLESGDAIDPAAIQAVLAIAADFMRQAKVSHGPSAVDPSKRPDDFFALADRIEREIGKTATADAGGISISEQDTLRTDPDWPDPFFERGQDDNSRFDNDIDDRRGC